MKIQHARLSKNTVFNLVVLGLLGNTSLHLSAEESVQKAVVEAKAVVYDVIDKMNLIVDFSASSAELSDSQKNDIDALVKALDRSPDHYNLALVAWSDHSLPFESGTNLSSEDVALADKRIKAVKDYIAALVPFKNTSKFNMAEKSSFLSRLFSDDDSDLKKEMEEKSSGNMEMRSLSDILKKKGKVSSVVVILTENKINLTH